MRKIAYKTKSGRYVLSNGDKVKFNGKEWIDTKPEYGEYCIYDAVYSSNKIVGFEPKGARYTKARHFIQYNSGLCVSFGALTILCIAGFEGYCGDIPIDEVLIRIVISAVLGAIGFALSNDADKKGR